MYSKKIGTNEVRTERIEKILLHKQPTLKVMLDGVHSSQNLSAILRTSDGVGIMHLYYSTSEDKDLRIHKTITQGAHRWVERIRVDTQKRTAFLREKQQKGYQVIVTHLESRAVSFREVDYTLPTIIVMGNEKEGVSPEITALADHVVVIPMMGMVQSLNVSVSAAVILYEAQRQREISGYYTAPQLSEKERETIKQGWLYRDIIARRSKGKIAL
ncbi:MAG: tRNA (guanine-N2)-dimethyltransferase [Epsilonproteobacteria bacterium 4484_20]|nr:MAG: tRNA (guanine-N2)-dimethyltransferase [Epsilonproteobacteria bacterium 4484_20]